MISENNILKQDNTKNKQNLKPTNAFIGASWFSLIMGVGSFLIGIWNTELSISEKGFYMSILVFGLFAVISVQKSVRDKQENIEVSTIYYSLSWFVVLFSVLALTIGLWHATLSSSEKGFYTVSYILSTFSAVTVQKNIRDLQD